MNAIITSGFLDLGN